MKYLMIVLVLFLAACGSPQVNTPKEKTPVLPKANYKEVDPDILHIDLREDVSVMDYMKRTKQVLPIPFVDKKFKKFAQTKCAARQEKSRKHKFSWPDINYRVLGKHPTRKVWLCAPDKMTKFQMKSNCIRLKRHLHKYDSKTYHTFSCIRREK